MRDHSSWEGWAKMKIHQKKKFNQIEDDEEKKKSKIHFIKIVCSIKSRKWKCIRNDKRVSWKNAKSSKNDESLSNWKKQKCSWMKANKIPHTHTHTHKTQKKNIYLLKNEEKKMRVSDLPTRYDAKKSKKRKSPS